MTAGELPRPKRRKFSSPDSGKILVRVFSLCGRSFRFPASPSKRMVVPAQVHASSFMSRKEPGGLHRPAAQNIHPALYPDTGVKGKRLMTVPVPALTLIEI